MTYIASTRYTPRAVATVATFHPTKIAREAIMNARKTVPLSPMSILGARLYFHATNKDGMSTASIQNTKIEFCRRAGVSSTI
jgi:hypothetical protein